MLKHIDGGEATLVVTVFNLIELANPAVRNVAEVWELLRYSSHLLTKPFEEIDEEEIASASVLKYA